MFGQGCPSGERVAFALATRKVARSVCVFVFALSSLVALRAQAQDVSMRLRLEWGGGTASLWDGTVSLSAGKLSRPVALGIEADEPGSMWIDRGTLHVHQRSGRTYDAVDVTVDAPVDAKLRVTLHEAADNNPAEPIEIPLDGLIQSVHNSELDGQGNRLLVRRAPGDRLRVQTTRDSLVFAPGETFAFRLQPFFPEVAAGTTLRISLEIEPARGGRALWSDQQEIRTVAPGQQQPELPMTIPISMGEGAYQLTIKASEYSLARRLAPVLPTKSLAERQIDLVVVDPDLRTETDVFSQDRPNWELVGAIDPVNPGWWKRLVELPQLSLIPGWPQGPLRNGTIRSRKHPLGTMIELVPRTTGSEVTWEAFPLPIEEAGKPHLLEIEYPSDVPQHLGISIVEPNVAGSVLPVGLDSGVYVSKHGAQGPAKIRTHRMLFWPKTETPLVLLTHRGDGEASVFRKIRVLSGPERLEKVVTTSEPNQRLVAAYLDRPLLAENFSATGVLDPWSGQGIDDWGTLHQGGSRLIEYLNHVGYNGLMLSVLADGSTIYPSKLLQPTPRYDNGGLSDQGQDPVRKDGLEMLFRMFDREGLRLVPALQFSAPLPQLEAALRRGGRDTIGIELIGPDGRPWDARHVPQRGLAPYYNPLHPAVQEAMLDVVRELSERYARHPSFEGLSIQLDSNGYTLLPGAQWAMDDVTVAQFARDTGIRFRESRGEERFEDRRQQLLGPHRKAWLKWRAAQLARFYTRLADTLAQSRPQAKLYLGGAHLLSGESARDRLRPTLPPVASVLEVLLELGIDVAHYAENPNLVLLRPSQSASPGSLYARSVGLQTSLAVELDRALVKAPSRGSLHFHPPERLRVPSFDRRSPFGASSTYTLLVSQSSPSGDVNRRRFIRSLARLDAADIFDGGWMLPMGQEDTVRPLLAVLRQLPSDGFKLSPASRQPVTIRTRHIGSDSFVYLANESPWPIEVTLQLTAARGCRLTQLGNPQKSVPLGTSAQGTTWSLTLAPYDLVAGRFSQPRVGVTRAEVTIASGDEDQLASRITDLEARATALASQPALAALSNPGFEMAQANQQIPGWTLAAQPGAAVELDQVQHHSGRQSLVLSSTRPVASLQSELFDTPDTGRLALSVWLRTDTVPSQPVLRLALEGPNNGLAYYRFAQVGGTGQGSVGLKPEWTHFIFQVDDIPTEGVQQMRVRFDLMGAGKVWLDDARLYHLNFKRNERVELSKILVSARGALNGGEYADCLRLLESYWPQFLETHIAPVDLPVARNARLPRPSVPLPEKPKPGTLDRFKSFLPKLLPF